MNEFSYLIVRSPNVMLAKVERVHEEGRCVVSSKLGIHAGDTDLLIPRLGPDENWDPHLIHTHYFGFSVPEAAIGAFLYIRYQPAFPLSQGGVCVFQGTENVEHTDMAYLDYEITMPWPTVEGNTITTD